MEIDKLSNIRHNIINGNMKDARELIIDYGVKSFPIDYYEFLDSLGFGGGGSMVINELRVALKQFSYLPRFTNN